MTKKKKKWLIIGGAIVLIVIFVALNLGKSSEAVVEVQAEKVKEGKIVSLVTATGTVQAKSTVKISADVSAKIVDLPIKEGDQVKKGNVLVRLDQTRYIAAFRQSEASLAAAQASEKRAEASLLEAKQNFERAKKLYDQKLISEENNLQIETALQVAEANFESARYFVKQQQASVEEVRDALDKTIITSPINGRITELNAEVGEIVMIGTMNNPGTVILTVADLSEIEVEVAVDETDIARVKEDQEAKIEVDAFPDTTFRGRVTEVGNAAQITGTSISDRSTDFLVTVLLTDTVAAIRPGMTATVDITVEQRDKALHIPIQAVVYRPEKKDTLAKTADSSVKKDEGAIAAGLDTSAAGTESSEKPKEIEGVFKVVDGVAQFLPVKTGIADQQNIEIVQGLSLNDEIITGSYKALRTIEDKAKVKVMKEPMKENK